MRSLPSTLAILSLSFTEAVAAAAAAAVAWERARAERARRRLGEETALPALLFGDEVPLFEARTLRLAIRNTTGPRAPLVHGSLLAPLGQVAQ